MEAFLRAWLPRCLPEGRTFEVHAFQGKSDLLAKLEARLRSYAAWLPQDWRVLVVVDRDDDDCIDLKRRLEDISKRAGLLSRSQAKGRAWQIVNRIAIEELEAWYFGDWEAVRAIYPRVAPGTPLRQAFRDPDAIAGGTWEAFERVMRKYGYFKGGLTKIDAARAIGAEIEPTRNRSVSFHAFHRALVEALA